MRLDSHQQFWKYNAKDYAWMTESWREDIRKLANFYSVYCKLSGMVTEAV